MSIKGPANKSSSDNHSQNFQNYKIKAKKKKLNFSSTNDKDYNQPFSMKEIESEIRLIAHLLDQMMFTISS